MYKRILALIVILFVATTTFTDEISSDSAKTLLLEVRDKIYNFDNNDSLISHNLLKSKSVFENIVNKKERLYWSAKIEYFEGLFDLKKKQNGFADAHFNACNLLLNRLTKECGEFSEVYSLLADSHIQLMLNKGIAYQILNGSKLKTLPEKAIKLDSANVKAYQSLAIYCMNAPEALGGGIHKAINILMNLSTNDKCELFNIYYLLGNAYMKMPNSNLASKYLRMALSLYPQNQWAEADLQVVINKLGRR